MQEIRVATAAYRIDMMSDWQAYADKQRRWVAEAAGAGAQLLVFPEYGGMELAGLAGPDQAGDRAGAIGAASARAGQANALHAALAAEFGVHILSGSVPVDTGPAVVNRAHFFAPSGLLGYQDKQIMTRFERDDWGVAGAGPLRVFDTDLGRIGILICYDCEFPLLARALVEAGVELLLVPSCTEAREGYWRVRIGAMARALEGQCVAVMASLVGLCPQIYGVEENTGAGGVFGPPDRGFPADGVLALGEMDRPGWTHARVSRDAIADVRADGHVLNMAHWVEQGHDGLRVDHIGAR